MSPSPQVSKSLSIPPSLIQELLFLLEDLQADVQYVSHCEREQRSPDVHWVDFYGARLSIAVKSLENLLIEREESR
jgi:hypothetical protein